MEEEYSSQGINIIDLSSMSFLELIRQIEERPYYLSERSIYCLDAFLNGYFAGKGYDADNGIMSRFNAFLETQFKVTTTHGWARIIAHYSQDSFDALERFFKLFNAFVEIENKANS